MDGGVHRARRRDDEGGHGVVDQRGLSKGFLVSPAWTLWFLVSLATMRILLPYIARMRHPLIFSIALALIGGLLALRISDEDAAPAMGKARQRPVAPEEAELAVELGG